MMSLSLIKLKRLVQEVRFVHVKLKRSLDHHLKVWCDTIHTPSCHIKEMNFSISKGKNIIQVILKRTIIS